MREPYSLKQKQKTKSRGESVLSPGRTKGEGEVYPLPGKQNLFYRRKIK